MHLSRSLALAGVLILLVATSVAEAKAPPKGRYACTIGGSTLFGTLYIKGKAKYRYDAYDGKGKPGKYKSKGKKIRLKTGPLKGSKGRWWISSTNNRVITLGNPKSDNFQSIECIREGK